METVNPVVVSKSTKRIGHYEVGRTLGRGTFGKVKYAVNVETGQHVAIKVMDKNKIQEQEMGTQIKQEIAVMKRIRHPNIVNMLEVLASKSKVYIVLELVTGGELFDKIVACGRLDEATAKRYFHELVAGIQYCHSLGVCHRDLKPENLLLDENDHVKLSDFGLSALVFDLNELDPDSAAAFIPIVDAPNNSDQMKIEIPVKTIDKAEDLLNPISTPDLAIQPVLSPLSSAVPPFSRNQSVTNVLYTTCGTPNYVAPEVVLNQGYNGASADMWSVGVILYVLLAGFLPFDDPHLPTLFAKIVKGEFVYPDWFSPLAMSLIDSLLVVNPAKRFSADDVLKHAWLSGSEISQVDTSHEFHFPENDIETAIKDSRPSIMNAFDLINHVNGDAISHMFHIQERKFKTHTHFLSKLPVDEILKSISDVLTHLNVTFRTNLETCKITFKLMSVKGWITGTMQVYVFAPEANAVESRRSSGDLFAYHAFFKEFHALFDDLINGKLPNVKGLSSNNST